MEPGCTQSDAKIEKNALHHQKWLPNGFQDSFTRIRSRLFDILYSILASHWSPRANQNPSQNAFFAGICVRRSGFLATLSAPVVFNPFSMDFACFLIENRLQFYRAVAHLGVISYPFKTMHSAGYPACGQCF